MAYNYSRDPNFYNPVSYQRGTSSTKIEGQTQTLRQQMACKGYPFAAFPPVAQDAMLEVQAIVKAPIEMIGGIALVAMALAAQDVVNVRRLTN